MAIEIKFDNRMQSIEVFKAFGMTGTVAALEAAEKRELYPQLYELCANVDADLEAGYHLYDNRGRVITRLDEWLLAVLEGRWL